MGRTRIKILSLLMVFMMVIAAWTPSVAKAGCTTLFLDDSDFNITKRHLLSGNIVYKNNQYTKMAYHYNKNGKCNYAKKYTYQKTEDGMRFVVYCYTPKAGTVKTLENLLCYEFYYDDKNKVNERGEWGRASTSSDWERTSDKIEYTYVTDDADRVVKATKYVNGIESDYVEYEYDEMNRIIKRNIYLSSKNVMNYEELVYDNDRLNKVIINQKDKCWEVEYEYNDQGYIAAEYRYSIENSSEDSGEGTNEDSINKVLQQKRTYTYDEYGNLKKEIVYGTDGKKTEWIKYKSDNTTVIPTTFDITFRIEEVD